MEVAKVFKNGRSQAVRLPKEYRFDSEEVLIKKTSQGVLLMPKQTDVWQQWSQKLDSLTIDDNTFTRQEQGKTQQRDSLDDLFD